MQYSFDLAFVQRLVAHAKASQKFRVLHDNPATNAPGLWCAGDHGLYLLSNGDPACLKQPGDPDYINDQFVVYADEVHPFTLDFDTWWSAKAAGFGGDDGVEFLPIADVDRQLAGAPWNDKFILEISPEMIDIPFVRVTARRKRKRG